LLTQKKVWMMNIAIADRPVRRGQWVAVALSAVLALQACQDETAVTDVAAVAEALIAPEVAAVTADRIIHADDEPGNWLSHGRTYDEQRFSPLQQVNADNAAQLGLAWYYDLDSTRGQEATPLVVDGVMYVSTAWSKVKALNAGTGELIWAYDLLLRCGQSRRRGVAGQSLHRYPGRPPHCAGRSQRQAGLGSPNHRSGFALLDHGRAAHRQGQGHYRQRRR
jgi:glucose dehydrogenase